MFCFKHLVFEPLIYSYMETEGVKNISVLKIFDYLMLHEPPNWPSVHCPLVFSILRERTVEEVMYLKIPTVLDSRGVSARYEVCVATTVGVSQLRGVPSMPLFTIWCLRTHLSCVLGAG